MSVVSSVLKFAARLSWIFVGSLAGFILLGLLLNIVLFCFLPDRCASDGGLGSVISDCADAVLIGAIFLPIFPIIYAVFGYRFALQRSLHFGYVQNREFLFRYLIDRFVGFAQKHAGGSIADATGLASRFLERLDKLPFVLRIVLQAVKKIVPMADLLDRISPEQLGEGYDRDKAAAHLANEADRYLQNDLLQPDTTLPKILVVVNLLAFILFKWAL